MPVSEETYRRLALEDHEGHWEWHCGRIRQKPPMSEAHEHLGVQLMVKFVNQLNPDEFTVRPNMGRVRTLESYYIPDFYVIPTEVAWPRRHGRNLEVWEMPLPLVVEIWSPSTGDYDVNVKLTEYKRRGDTEVWLIHPYDRTFTVWRRQPDGSYSESIQTAGVVSPVAVPNVTLDLDTFFD